MTLDEFDHLPPEVAAEALRRCCGASRWVAAMVAARPFGSVDRLYEAAEATWGACERADWLEAFSHHPRIGDLAGLRRRFADTAAWAAGEQAGAARASEEALAALAAGNEAYERRFGHIFIVCATGKSAPEMLALLDARLGNGPEAEAHVAASEQHKITRIRLEKLLS